VARAPGLSVRLKLTLSYAGFLMLAGGLLLVAAWLAGQPGQSSDFLLRYVPDDVISTLGGLVPGNRSFLLRAFAPAAAIVLAFLLVFGLLGGGGCSPAACSPP
jgi:two-component system, OmpR family, sensor histidine kinase VanS